jgi:hypothetical protein
MPRGGGSVPKWYQGSVEIIDRRTLKVTLPDGMKVSPDQAVPPEILEMMAAYLRLSYDSLLREADGCGVQLGRAAEGCVLQSGMASAEGCVIQFGSSGSQLTGSGTAVTRMKSVDAFDAVHFLGMGQVTVAVGNEQSVQVTFDDNLQDIVSCIVADGMLTIRTTQSYSSRLGLSVAISAPQVTRLDLQGQSAVEAKGISGPRFDANLSGQASLTAFGTVGLLQAKIGGAGKLACFGLSASSVNVAIQGQGHAEVTALQALRVDITGMADVVYRGNPADIQKKIVGAGTVQPG